MPLLKEKQIAYSANVIVKNMKEGIHHYIKKTSWIIHCTIHWYDGELFSQLQGGN